MNRTSNHLNTNTEEHLTSLPFFNIKTLILLGGLCIPLLGFSQNNKESKNKKISVVTTWNEEKGIKTKDEVVKYNASGQVIEEITYELGKEKEKYTYVYDAQGKKIEEREFTLGKLSKIIKYEYIDDLKKSKTTFSPDGKLKKKKIYEYQYR